MNIAEQIQLVRINIEQFCLESARSSDQVQLLAVSKTHPVSLIQAAAENGITDFGESYLQEALKKIAQSHHLKVNWHFIGPIQSNKTKLIAENFDWVQSVDREKILLRLSQQRPEHLEPLQVCIQANLFDESQKKGVNLSQLYDLLEIASQQPQIKLRGLMVIPPVQESFEKQLLQFKQVSDLYAELKLKFTTMDTLSMGMSGDMRAAIHCGSNMVRIGTGIFGSRGTNF